MEGSVYVERGSCATAQESYEAIPASEPNLPRRGWQFVSEFQRLMGDDSEPDTLFFVESWTLGMPAAVENLQQRRQRQADRKRSRHTFREFDTPGTESFLLERELFAEYVSSPHGPSIAECFDADWPRQSSEEPATAMQDEAPQEWDIFAEECSGNLETIHPITLESARQFLGVSETSTLKQIKAAYRKMVSKWHPDRFDLRTEEVRQRANERMAAINEAYHLLCNSVAKESA
jgi:hypothetical protein